MNAFPQRLKSARIMKGLSLQDLADLMEPTISRQALHKYESGALKPNGKIIINLSKVLGVKPDYFLKEPMELGKVAFRKKAKLGAKQVDSIKEIVKDFLQRYLEVEQLLNLNTEFVNPVKSMPVSAPEDVDDIVIELIKSWNLGYDPIPSVIEMLEERGVRVIEIDASEAFDGFSTFVGNIPVVVINKNFTTDRKRFTALHELGHLVLAIEDGADEEKICNAFAGAMLLPDDCLNRLLGDIRHNIAAGELVSIKEQYGISIQAIIKRAEMKGIIDKNAATRFWKFISSNKREEGLGNFLGREKSSRFEMLVYRLAAEEVVSLSKAASLAGLKVAEFRDRLEATLA